MGSVSSFPLATTPMATVLASLNFALYKATSTTSLAVGTGSKVFTTQSGKDFVVGDYVLATSDADAANYMIGQITAYSGTSLTISVPASNYTGGSGTLADWTLRLSGPPGATGETGPSAWAAPLAWATATAYVATAPASVVTQGGETYVCLVAHTSGVFATDLAAAKWIKVAAKGADGAGTGDMSKATYDPNDDGIIAVAQGGTGAANAASARSNLAAAAQSQTAEFISGFIRSPANQDYRLIVKIPHGGTITEVTTRSASGTCTATFKVNTTALGGTANSVSSTEQSQSHASSNTFVADDDIVVTISSNSSCGDMSFTIKYTRTLA